MKCITVGNAYVCCAANVQLKQNPKKHPIFFADHMAFSILPPILQVLITNSIACLNRLALLNMKIDFEMSLNIIHLFSYNQQSASSHIQSCAQ